MNTFTDITKKLTDINESDRVFKTNTGEYIKVRAVQVDLEAQAQPEDRASMLVLEISASLTDKQGKALSDSEGFMLVPAQRHSFNIAGIDDSDITIEDIVENLIQDACRLALKYKKVKNAKKSFKRKESDSKSVVIQLNRKNRRVIKKANSKGIDTLDTEETEVLLNVLGRLGKA